jgi:hypothetical protein
VYKQVLVNAELQIVKRGKKTELTGEVQYVGEGPHWTAVPFKKRKKKNAAEFA